MAKKQVQTNPIVAAAVPSVTAGKKKATAEPRVSAARHSKPKVEVPVEPIVAAEVIMEEVPTAGSGENAQDSIAKIAYGYFEARGYSHGNPLDDWFRAEREYYSTRK